MRNLQRKIKAGFLSLALWALSVALVGCGAEDKPAAEQTLTWGSWSGYESFLQLVAETYPDIKLEYVNYAGKNRTGYSWAQMRADDIPDIFITSQILDSSLAAERLVDLSGYPFVNNFSNAVLDQVAIDGGIHLLPVNYAMYGIFYNKTLLEENGWQLPTNFAELEELCAQIREEGMIPGILGTQLTGNVFSAVFNLAKTSWFTTPNGAAWEQQFLAGEAEAAGYWEPTMEYVQRYIDIGMFQTDPEDRNNPALILDYLGNRKAMFFTAVLTVNITELPETGDKLGLMPYIGEDGSKNIYMYSPSSYIGISSRLLEPGNEQKLADAVKILSLLYSPEGQATFITEETPCILSVLSNVELPEDSMIYDAQQALREGRAFPMTYANWDSILSDIGQAYKDWLRGVDGMDGAGCIAKMDELRQSAEQVYFCESTTDFSMEETAVLLGKALGQAVGADVVLMPYCEHYNGGSLPMGVSGKLYAGKINADVMNTICPAADGEYGLALMTGAEIKAAAAAGFDLAGDGEPFPYALVVRGGAELADEQVYQTAFPVQGYTDEVRQRYNIQLQEGYLQTFLRSWLEEQKVVSPDGNPWE